MKKKKKKNQMHPTSPDAFNAVSKNSLVKIRRHSDWLKVLAEMDVAGIYFKKVISTKETVKQNPPEEK